MADSVQSVDVAWTWGSILKLACTTGFVTAAFNQGFAWVKEAWQRRQEDRRLGRALALDLVENLTRYAQECSSRARQNRYVAESGEYGGSEIPAFPPYEEHAGWGALPPKVAGALRDLRNEVEEARRGVAETDYVCGPPESIDHATYHYDHLGYMAWQIAKGLRRHYGLGPYAGQSSFAAELRQQHRKHRRGIIRKFWRSLFVARLRGRGRRWKRLWRDRLDDFKHRTGAK